MPRRPRTHLDGVPLHIVQRGHNREPCLFGEADYQTYLYWLGEALKKEHCALHAYALMTNHLHLLVTPDRADAPPAHHCPWAGKYIDPFRSCLGHPEWLCCVPGRCNDDLSPRHCRDVQPTGPSRRVRLQEIFSVSRSR